MNMYYFDRRVICDPRGRGGLIYRRAPGGTAEIVEIEVQSECRRTGVGRELLNAMLVELPDDVAGVFAFTRRSNHIARHWYEALGFRGTFIADFYGDDDRDAVLYTKRIR